MDETMPQPIRKLKGVLREGPEVLLERQWLAVGIAMIAAHWSRIENSAAHVFAALLSSQEEAALSGYTALIDRSVREAVFHAVAEVKLSLDLQTQARAVFQELRKRAAERNDVVHGTWAIASEKPDSLILLNAKDLIHWSFEDDRKTRSPEIFAKFQQRVKMMEYKEGDFNNILHRLHRLETNIRELRRAIEKYIAGIAQAPTWR